MEYMKVRSLTEEVKSLKMPRPAAAAPAQPIVAGTRIVCPVCKGEKVIMIGDLLHRTVQNCPVCAGIGYRILEIRAGMAICPDCQGMGLVYFGNPDQGIPITTSHCVRCGMSGLIATVK
jgi:DnaJ-class molecular chaperone